MASNLIDIDLTNLNSNSDSICVFTCSKFSHAYRTGQVLFEPMKEIQRF